MSLLAQDSFAVQFNLAKKLYEAEKYFDAVTEFKRLLFFNDRDIYNYESNLLIGLSYKKAAKFSEAKSGRAPVFLLRMFSSQLPGKKQIWP